MWESYHLPDAGDGDATGDQFRRAIQSRLRPAAAPESLRARIGAMLAAERAPAR